MEICWQDDFDIVEDLRFMDTVKMQYKLRNQTVERIFGNAKEKYGMRWTRYKGVKKLSMDTTLICTAMNLKNGNLPYKRPSFCLKAHCYLIKLTNRCK